MVEGYDWHTPDFSLTTTWLALGLIVLGIALVIVMESMANEPATG